MSRITRITGPDGKVTTIVTRSSGCGCLTTLAAFVVFFLPAGFGFGAWAVPAYIFLGILIVAAVAAQVRQNGQRPTPGAEPPPAPAPPPPFR